MAQDKVLSEDYQKFISEYKFLRHMLLAQKSGLYIISHECKQANGELKLCVAFDAFARSQYGQFLNYVLHTLGLNCNGILSLLFCNFGYINMHFPPTYAKCKNK